MTLEARFREVGRRFGIPDGARWSVLPGGHINATRRAQWAGGDVLLQRVNPAVFPDPEIPCRNGARVLAHLAGKGFPIPQAVPAEGGAPWLKEDDGCWRAFAFLGTHGGAERTPERAPEAGRALGALLAALEDFPASQLAPALPGYHALDHQISTPCSRGPWPWILGISFAPLPRPGSSGRRRRRGPCSPASAPPAPPFSNPSGPSQGSPCLRWLGPQRPWPGCSRSASLPIISREIATSPWPLAGTTSSGA
ncbi:MAG: hypothetical protein EBU29_05745 [Gammaproteobacteria bacterium]|nr:hypothetical protein [Gammaproteobacteria bacterium]